MAGIALVPALFSCLKLPQVTIGQTKMPQGVEGGGRFCVGHLVDAMMVFACLAVVEWLNEKICEQRPMIQSVEIFQISCGYPVGHGMNVPLLFIRLIQILIIHWNREAQVNSQPFFVVGTQGMRKADCGRKAGGRCQQIFLLNSRRYEKEELHKQSHLHQTFVGSNLTSGKSYYCT